MTGGIERVEGALISPSRSEIYLHVGSIFGEVSMTQRIQVGVNEQKNKLIAVSISLRQFPSEIPAI
jgi:hypothetical protein